jgi:hypothetical protein
VRQAHVSPAEEVKLSAYVVISHFRASAFYTKPAQDSAQLWHGLSKVIFFPAFRSWWATKASLKCLNMPGPAAS